MQQVVITISRSPEFGLDGGARWEYYRKPAYLQLPAKPAMTLEMLAMMAMVAKMNTSLDFVQAIPDDKYLLRQIQGEQLKAALEQQWKQDLSSLQHNLTAKFSMVVMQKDKDLAEEKKEATKLKQDLKKVEAEKNMWEKIARKMSAAIAVLKQTITRAYQKNSMSSSAAGEEVASSFPCNPGDDDHDTKYDDVDEPAVPKSLKKKRRVPHSDSNFDSSSSLCKNCSRNFSGFVL